MDTQDPIMGEETAVETHEEWALRKRREAMVVSMRQARLALAGTGLLSKVETAIASLDEPHKTAAEIEWNYSQTVERDKALVAMLAPALGLDDEALDDLFKEAAKL